MKFLKTINEFFTYKGDNYIKPYYDFIQSESGNYTESELDDIVSILKRDCSDFIDELSKSETLLFRGIKRNLGDSIKRGIWKKKSHKERIPTDMSQSVSDKFDELFAQELGVYLRSEGVFAAKNIEDTFSYGSFDDDIRVKTRGSFNKRVYLFFPIGEYSYYWNHSVIDLYSDIENETWYNYFTDIIHNEDTSGLEEMLIEDWEILYNRPGSSGQWVYKGERTGYSDLSQVKRKFDIPDVTTDLVWDPDIELDEFIEEEIDRIKDDMYGEMDRIVSGYRSGGLKDVNRQELTFICDEYYIVDVVLLFRIAERLGIKSK
jgi:hypothetical protein